MAWRQGTAPQVRRAISRRWAVRDAGVPCRVVLAACTVRSDRRHRGCRGGSAMTFLALPPAPAGLASPPATARPLTQAAFQAEVVRLACLLGWRVFESSPGARGQQGFPHLVMVRQPRCLFAVLRAQRTPTTADQWAWLVALRCSGLDAYLWRPSDIAMLTRVLK